MSQFKFFIITSSIVRKMGRKKLVEKIFSEIILAEIYDERNTNDKNMLKTQFSVIFRTEK